MAESGIFRLATLQGWQRENILAAASFLREQYGNPPSNARAKVVHDGLLEVIEPSRRAVRLQREMSVAARAAAITAKQERRAAAERRAADRRKANFGPPSGVSDRRKGERRAGSDRRTKK
jgi:hypothetical protein